MRCPYDPKHQSSVGQTPLRDPTHSGDIFEEGKHCMPTAAPPRRQAKKARGHCADLITGVAAIIRMGRSSVAGPTGLGLICFQLLVVEQPCILLRPHLVLLHFIINSLPSAGQPPLVHRMVLHAAHCPKRVRGAVVAASGSACTVPLRRCGAWVAGSRSKISAQ